MSRLARHALFTLAVLTMAGCTVELTPSGAESTTFGGFQLSSWRVGLELAGGGFVAGALCALWAQGTQRNAWLWFFLGWFFAPITLLVLLWKNAKDKAASAGHGGTV